MYLDLSHNSLSIFEQPHILPWKMMNFSDLSSNKLGGSLMTLPLSLVYFFASKNNLTGTIPPMICQMKSLQVLDISNNQLIGQIPQCLGDFSNSLLVLNLRNNRFHGNLPETFIEGSNLKTLDFSHNQIQGKIPRSLLKCKMLEILNLGNDNMNDTFPFWLESSPELQILILPGNGFHCAIWDAHNNFSGKLPSQYFKTWTGMVIVPM